MDASNFIGPSELIWGTKSSIFLSKKNLSPKKFWAQKNVAQKDLGKKTFDPKHVWYKQNFRYKKTEMEFKKCGRNFSND